MSRAVQRTEDRTDGAIATGQIEPRPKSSWAAIGIFTILAFGAATLARSFLMPLCFGILLFFVFAPPCRGLARWGVPQAVSAAFVSLGLLVGFGAAITLLAVPLSSAMENAPFILDRLGERLEAVSGPLQAVQDGLDQLGQAGTTAPAANGPGVLTSIAAWTPAVFGQIVFTLVLLFFMLSTREMLYERTIESFSTFRDKKRALSAMYEIERSLGHYLGAITVINAGLGIAVGIAMWLLSMPTPALFGVMAFAFNFVPFLGAIAGVIVALIVALISMEDFVGPIVVAASYFGLTAIEGQVVTPFFVSQRLRLNTVVVFIAVALFAWLWSVVGMIVAVPMLVVVNVVCARVPMLSSFGAFLSGPRE